MKYYALLIGLLIVNTTNAQPGNLEAFKSAIVNNSQVSFLCHPYTERHNLMGALGDLVRSYQKTSSDISTLLKGFPEQAKMLENLQKSLKQTCLDLERLSMQRYNQQVYQDVQDQLINTSKGFLI